MNPAPSPQAYYQHLLAAARAIGMQEAQLLLGLLWHAPLGDARERPQGWKYLQQLLDGAVLPAQLQGGDPQADASGQSPSPGERVRAIPREPGPGLESLPGLPPLERECGSRPPSGHTTISLAWPGETPPGDGRTLRSPQPDAGQSGDSWQEFVKASQENLVVERQRYEAMIYELGKLQVWQEICKQERREKKTLNLKLEAQLAREVDYLRYLLKKNA